MCRRHCRQAELPNLGVGAELKLQERTQMPSRRWEERILTQHLLGLTGWAPKPMQSQSSEQHLGQTHCILVDFLLLEENILAQKQPWEERVSMSYGSLKKRQGRSSKQESGGRC